MSCWPAMAMAIGQERDPSAEVKQTRKQMKRNINPIQDSNLCLSLKGQIIHYWSFFHSFSISNHYHCLWCSSRGHSLIWFVYCYVAPETTEAESNQIWAEQVRSPFLLKCFSNKKKVCWNNLISSSSFVFLYSNSDIEAPTEVYKSSIDSLI